MNVDPVRTPIQGTATHAIEHMAAPQFDAAQAEFQQRFQQLMSKSAGPDAPALSDTARAQSLEKDELKEAFCDFVGQTLFGQMIASMRSTQQEPAYFHGGQAERIFQNQLDQELAESISKASADTVAGPMYDLFRLRRAP